MNAPILSFADAQSAFPFVLAQGRNLETEIYNTRYRAFNYARHIPVVTEGNQWAIGTMFRVEDTTGQAKLLSGSGTDMPFNTVTRDLKTHDFTMIGAGWEWNIEEINQAALYGSGLEASKANAATMSVERLLNTIAMTGLTAKNWTGLVNDAAVTATDVAADGTGSSTYWAAKTPALILRDVNTLLESISTGSGEVEYADTLRLPPAAMRQIAGTALLAGDGSMSILDLIRKTNSYTGATGQPLDIDSIPELASAAAGGAGRMVAYRKAKDVVRFHLPMARLVLPIHQKSIMGFETGVIARTGGTEIRLPKAMGYGDLITAA